MKRRKWFLPAVFVVGVMTAFAAHHESGEMPDARFAFLKGLEGAWNVSGDGHKEGMPDGGFEFQVGAGGSIVEERQMTGTPMAMLTVYHLDGADLVATHYCMLGNQPHLKADKAATDQGLRFTCTEDVGGATSHDEQHIHGWTLKLADDGSLAYSVDIFQDGQVVNSSEMQLTRQE